MSLPCGAKGRSVVSYYLIICDCGIFSSYSIAFIRIAYYFLTSHAVLIIIVPEYFRILHLARSYLKNMMFINIAFSCLWRLLSSKAK